MQHDEFMGLVQQRLNDASPDPPQRSAAPGRASSKIR